MWNWFRGTIFSEIVAFSGGCDGIGSGAGWFAGGKFAVMGWDGMEAWFG
jgi:hypothetical protein